VFPPGDVRGCSTGATAGRRPQVWPVAPSRDGTGGSVGPSRGKTPPDGAPRGPRRIGPWDESRSPLDVAGLELLAARGRRGTEEARLGDWLPRAARWTRQQVSAPSAPARALYRRAGFIEDHRYHYRYAPA
jgi:hypothetical protein